MTATGASRTARERARAELTREIKEEARRQLAAHGAQGLSLRAVARELGMASSALYRYFPSRDDLLTALIIDAYDALGEAAEAAGAALPAADIRGRWAAACHAVRGLGARAPARVRADLRLAGARLPGASGDHPARDPGPRVLAAACSPTPGAESRHAAGGLRNSAADSGRSRRPSRSRPPPWPMRSRRAFPKP